MIQTLYDFPLPNNSDRYDLSQEELDALLYKAYMNGYQWGKEVNASTVVSTTSNDAFFADKNKWKEVRIK